MSEQSLTTLQQAFARYVQEHCPDTDGLQQALLWQTFIGGAGFILGELVLCEHLSQERAEARLAALMREAAPTLKRLMKQK